MEKKAATTDRWAALSLLAAPEWDNFLVETTETEVFELKERFLCELVEGELVAPIAH